MSGQNDREVLLSLRNVEISFDVGGKHKFKAVQDASFDIYRGETFALVGESGSGKTTIGRAIMRINPLSAGEILFEGKRISGKLSKQDVDRQARYAKKDNVFSALFLLLPGGADFLIHTIPSVYAVGSSVQSSTMNGSTVLFTAL